MPETLPEGWEKYDDSLYIRPRDNALVSLNLNGKWVPEPPPTKGKRMIPEDDFLSAMLALNAAYPLKGEENAERD